MTTTATPKEAARDLLKALHAPAWAVSVAIALENGQKSLVVRVDPGYRIPVHIPSSYEGYPVSMTWRTPTRAQISK